MESVWEMGFLQSLIADLQLDFNSAGVVMVVNVLLSQLISNVPMVALCLPMLSHLGAATEEMMALAAGSTIAGNFSILGAASNIIIIQNAERKEVKTPTFWGYARIGIPMTVVNVAVY